MLVYLHLWYVYKTDYNIYELICYLILSLFLVPNVVFSNICYAAFDIIYNAGINNTLSIAQVKQTFGDVLNQKFSPRIFLCIYLLIFLLIIY